MARAIALILAGALATLSACSKDGPEGDAPGTAIPEDAARQLDKPAPPRAAASALGGTPMAERVATLGLLNKRNNLSEDITLKPGESKRIGNVVVKLSACERTPAWERPRETGAFVQVLVEERKDVDSPLRWSKVFSGWLFKHSPSLNVVEHPVYDVWVKDCAMKYPGEEAPASSTPASSVPARPAAATAPAPAAASPSAANASGNGGASAPD